MAAGALMGFIGCLLSIVNPIPFCLIFALYGLTQGRCYVILIRYTCLLKAELLKQHCLLLLYG